MAVIKPRVVFFGNEKLATGVENTSPVLLEALKKAGFEIEQHVTGPISDLRPHEAQIAVLAAYGHIVPQKVLDEFPAGIINIHPSLLPLYRGSSPIEQAILDGATKTGVSIMKLTAGMDEGPVYKQKIISLDGDETKTALTQKLQNFGAELLLEVLPGIIVGKLKPRQQPHPDRATYSRKIAKEDGQIDWTKPAEVLEREIRAYLEWPKSYTTFAGRDVIITKAHLEQDSVDRVRGTVFATEDKKIAVQTGDGLLVIDALKPSGKKEMSAEEFLRGYST